MFSLFRSTVGVNRSDVGYHLFDGGGCLGDTGSLAFDEAVEGFDVPVDLFHRGQRFGNAGRLIHYLVLYRFDVCGDFRDRRTGFRHIAGQIFPDLFQFPYRFPNILHETLQMIQENVEPLAHFAQFVLTVYGKPNREIPGPFCQVLRDGGGLSDGPNDETANSDNEQRNDCSEGDKHDNDRSKEVEHPFH